MSRCSQDSVVPDLQMQLHVEMYVHHPIRSLIKEAAKSVDQGKGVLFVYGCYAGDNLNFDMAEELLQAEGIKTAHVRVWDDLASAPKERIPDRRGIAGDVFVIKVAGAACVLEFDLD